MTGWLISVKLAMGKRSQKVGGLASGNVAKYFNMGTDLTKAFEYLLATGNLVSKTGIIV